MGREPDQPEPARSRIVGRDQGQGLGVGRWYGGRLWNVDKFYRTMGNADPGGVGGDLPIGIGAALAHKKHGRLCVRFQNDGDMMYVCSALWTATHHRIPLLLVMHNNRAYHQEVMHLQRMANRRQRGTRHRASRLPRHDDHGSEHRLRHAGAEHGRVRRGPHLRPEGPSSGAPARGRASREG